MRMMRKIDIAFPHDGRSAPPLEPPVVGNGAVEGRYKSWTLVVASIVLLSGALVVFANDWIMGRSEHILLSLYGSTTLGDELAPKLAEAFLHDEFG